MNIWNETYPEDFKQLIKLCDQSLIKIEKLLNSKDCKCLNELYLPNSRGEISRKKDLFEMLGYTPNTRLNDKSKQNDELSGLYVFGEFVQSEGKIIPRYVGISRTIYRRLKQHSWGKRHNEATFATLKHIQKKKFKGLRADITENEIKTQQEIIRNYKVAILPEDDFYTMYFMEVYLAGKWKTLWNTFKTH